MTFKFFISSAVVAAVITLIGNVVAAIISHKTAVKTAQETAGSEIQKMQATWDREDVVSSADEFAEMAAAVARYTSLGTAVHQSEALAKVAAIRSKESGKLGSELDSLYDDIRSDRPDSADLSLGLAISAKRSLSTQKSEES